MEGQLMCVHLLPWKAHLLLNLHNRRCAAREGCCRPPLDLSLGPTPYCCMLMLLMGL